MRPGDLDLSHPDTFASGVPHEYFSVLRREAPVCWNPPPSERGKGMPIRQGFYSVVKYEDLVSVSRNPKLFSSEVGSSMMHDLDPAGLAQVRAMLLNMDPPSHVKYRRLVQRGFTPKMVQELEPAIRAAARGVVDAVAKKGACDFVSELASELPLILICELMGIPPEDRRQVFDWSNQMLGFDDPEYGGSAEHSRAVAQKMWLYSNGLADKKEAQPDETLISKYVNGTVDGEKITRFELNNFFVLLAIAGNETTRTATSQGMRLLCENPDQYDRLRSDPERYLPGAIEEILRCSSPVMHFRRTATEDTELRGVRIRAGEKVIVWYPSANRDEEIFADSQRFDITRTPNPHVAFGIGEHFCLGANLARMQLRSIFEELLRRLPDLHIVEPPRLLRSNFIDGVKEMRVAFTPESA